jgi:hypothetical protein
LNLNAGNRGTQVAVTSGVTSNLITIIFAALLALFLAGSIATFLLAVPALSLISVVLILLAFVLMFALGIHAGGRRIRIRRRHTDLI